MEEKIEHLKMIQEVIKRMADNSFKLKGWAITVTAAVVGIGFDNWKWEMGLAMTFFLLIFMGLDGYYLSLERKFRGLYSLALRDEIDTFSLNIGRDCLDTWENNWFRCCFRPAVLLYFLSIIVPVLVFSVLRGKGLI